MRCQVAEAHVEVLHTTDCVGLVYLDAVRVAPQRAPRVRANPTPVLFLAWLPLSLADSLRRHALSPVITHHQAWGGTSGPLQLHWAAPAGGGCLCNCMRRVVRRPGRRLRRAGSSFRWAS